MHLLTLIIVYSFKALLLVFFFFFFFNDTATTEIYTLSLHDALPISLALRTAAAAMALSKTPLSATAMRALMVHNADHAQKDLRSEVGWGQFPENHENLLTYGDNQVSVLYQGFIQIGRASCRERV